VRLVGERLLGRTFASLRKHRNYRLFFGGQVVSLAGTWMQNIALAWLVVELSDSPLAVGLLAFCRFVPFTLLGLVAGVAVDRFDVRRLVITTQSAQMVVRTCSLRSAAPRSSSTRPGGTRSRSRWWAATSFRTRSRSTRASSTRPA
jgi:MFS family permease